MEIENTPPLESPLSKGGLTTDKLLDCPRCGSQGASVVKLASRLCYAVICEDCGRQTQQYMAEESAVAAWNNRRELRF